MGKRAFIHCSRISSVVAENENVPSWVMVWKLEKKRKIGGFSIIQRQQEKKEKKKKIGLTKISC
jgi:hypothetical protein